MHTDVNVSISALPEVDEGDEEILVCAILSALEDTERSFTVTLATNESDGNQKFRSIDNLLLYFSTSISSNGQFRLHQCLL